MKKIGYVLSGGGARGFAHLGVLKLLEELTIKPYAISGTSAGAIVGVWYAAGKTAEEIHSAMKNNSYFGWSNIAWRKKGLFSMDVLANLLKTIISKNDFDTLPIKLFVAATDLIEGKSVIFSKGNLLEAVIASASIPVVFEPVKIDNKLFVDGGVLNNFPVEPLISICDRIIGSYVNKIDDGFGAGGVYRTADMIDRCFHLAISNSVYSKVDKCDVFIESALHKYDMYDVKQADKIFDIGYKTALEHKEKIISLID
ncbi:MAG: patatin-like phospholipase family protein [Chitinophagaceae bacterium]